MGALTSKPTAFNFRTWELNSLKYVSCQDSLVPNIRVDIFQKKIVRVLPLDQWINDSIRFLFLNLDKQTFKSPALIFNVKSKFIFLKKKKLLRYHTYIVAMHYLVKRILKKRSNKMNLNLIIGSIFSNNLNLYQGLTTKTNNLNLIFKNSFLTSEPNLINYNEIYLLNLNPRLDSPLFNLELKNNENINIKCIGNFTSNYKIISNNLKKIFGISSKSLIIVSESLKNNQLLKSLKNDSMNLSPVYLNFPLVNLENNNLNNNLGDSINMTVCSTEIINLNKKNFNVEFATNVNELSFDIFFPITNYFVSSGELISLKGTHKLKAIRPSFSVRDHIISLSLMLDGFKNLVNNNLNTTKILLFQPKNKMFNLKNRLCYLFKYSLSLQKLNEKKYGQN